MLAQHQVYRVTSRGYDSTRTPDARWDEANERIREATERAREQDARAMENRSRVARSTRRRKR